MVCSHFGSSHLRSGLLVLPLPHLSLDGGCGGTCWPRRVTSMALATSPCSGCVVGGRAREGVFFAYGQFIIGNFTSRVKVAPLLSTACSSSMSGLRSSRCLAVLRHSVRRPRLGWLSVVVGIFLGPCFFVMEFYVAWHGLLWWRAAGRGRLWRQRDVRGSDALCAGGLGDCGRCLWLWRKRRCWFVSMVNSQIRTGTFGRGCCGVRLRMHDLLFRCRGKNVIGIPISPYRWCKV